MAGSSARTGARARRWRRHPLEPLLLFAVLLLAGAAWFGASASASPARAGGLEARSTGALPAFTPDPNITGVQLGIQSDAAAICTGGVSDCSAGNGVDQVTLTAQAGSPTVRAWPAVQMLFLLETSPYDGVYDPSAGAPGADPCGNAAYGTGTLCEESNGVPLFEVDAGRLAATLQAKYPYTNLSFGLVDFFATRDAFDSGGGAYYHVDVGSFVNSSGFEAAVINDFEEKVLQGGFILPNSDLRENFLHASSITALYGALEGAGINWSASAHHVIVIIGSAAPRDPNYPENYCASPAVTPDGFANCTAPTCEPSNLLPGDIAVPTCEGWVVSNTTNSSEDLANLAHTSGPCALSLGTNCTVDVVDLYDTPTDPGSPSWSESGNGGGPTDWTTDARNILLAGCDMAAATGGSWDGPDWFVCPDGRPGTLALVGHGPAAEPDVNNPTLYSALSNVSLGDPGGVYLASAAPDRPLFLFVPYGAFAVAPFSSFVQQCANATGAAFPCPGPTRVQLGSTIAYGWNISDLPMTNGLRAGDTWSSTFFVESGGPPYGTVPVDACITRACLESGSHPVLGNFTDTAYRPYEGSVVAVLSFPVALIAVEPSLYSGVGGPPAAPPAGVPLGSPPGAGGTPPPTSAPPAASPVPAPAVAVSTFTSGIIAAGAIRLGVRRPGQEMKSATPSGAGRRKSGLPGPTRVGHWE
jgi:hypothetical protein